MKILVTGGCGFIGREVCKQLMQKGHHVRVADNLSKFSTLPENSEFLNTDLVKQENADKAMHDREICIHLASKMGGLGYINKEPADILDGSLKLLSSVFEAARKNKTRVIYTSSSMVFESTTKFPSKEEDVETIPPPKTSYGFSKLVGEYYCKAYHEQYGLQYTIIRPFNVYGINAFLHNEVGYANVIPDLIRKTLKAKQVEILGDGKQTRCFTHVKDIAKAYVMAVENPKAINNDFDIGTEEEITILELAKKIWQLCRKEPFEATFAQGFKHDTKKRVPDISKARTILEWKPTIQLDDGLKEVVEWLKSSKE